LYTTNLQLFVNYADNKRNKHIFSLSVSNLPVLASR
jgi:hypothetical protein